MEGRKILYYVAEKNGYDFHKMYAVVNQHKFEFNDQDVEEVCSKASNNFITILDVGYPERLKRIYNPAMVLNYEGDISVLSKSGKFIFLFDRANTFNLSEDIVVTISEGMINVGGVLKLWLNKKYEDIVPLHNIAAGLCRVVAILTPVLDHQEMAASVLITSMLNIGGDVYVAPTVNPSFNNKLIKEGAYLADCKEDLDVKED